MELWPLPRDFSYGNLNLWLSPELRYSHRKVACEHGSTAWYRDLKCSTDPFLETGFSPKVIQYPSDLLQAAFERFKIRVFSENIVPDKFHPRRACFEPNPDESRTYISQVAIEELDNDHAQISKEAYAINVTPDDPTIKIQIAFPDGALRAFDSLAQLFYAHSRSDQGVYTPFAPVSIRDAPAFEHRGVMLDIARNLIPPQDVIRTIDAMGFNKLNRLRLHDQDSQCWPFKIPGFPKSAKKRAYREEKIWSLNDLEEVQRYGLYRGVEVYLEIDTPGENGSILHIRHNASKNRPKPPCQKYSKEPPCQKYSKEPPSGQLKINSPEESSFVSSLLGDLLARVSPLNTRFHIGGDKFNFEAYKIDPTVLSSYKEDHRSLFGKFLEDTILIVRSYSLTPHVWEDTLVEWDFNFPPNTIFQNWRPGGLRKIVDKGYRALFGGCDEWYLNCGFGKFVDPLNTNPPIKLPSADWCPSDENLQRVLAYNPLKDIPEEKQHLVLGGEVHLWTELTDSVTLDFMLWPRAAAAAEMMWRGTGEVEDMTARRLAIMRERLVRSGIRAGMIQMG